MIMHVMTGIALGSAFGAMASRRWGAAPVSTVFVFLTSAAAGFLSIWLEAAQ